MALFSGEVTLNVAVTAGEFNVLATPVDADQDGKLDVKKGSEFGTPFVIVDEEKTNLQDNSIVLDRMTPGDWISFKITVKNNSDIAVKCLPKIVKEDELSQYLSVSWRTNENEEFKSESTDALYIGAENGNNELTFEVKITLSKDMTAAQGAGKIGNIKYIVEAWQSNAEKPNT